MKAVKKQLLLCSRCNVKTMPGCLVSDEKFSAKESLMNKIVGPPRKLQGLGNFCRFVEQSAKKTLGSGNLNENIEKKRGEARGSEGKRGGAGGSGGKRGGSGGKRGEAGGKRGEVGGSGEKGGGSGKRGGKRGKTG